MPNPFEYILDPSNPSGSAAGGMLGMLGSMMGQPTQKQRAGQATGQALQEFQRLVQEKGSPQAALLDFMKTPQGQEMFMRDPEALKSLATFKEIGLPEKPQIINPGDKAIDRAGNTVASNPTQAVQTYDHMASIANLDKATQAELAKIQLMPNSSEKERAAMRLKAARPDLAQGLDMLLTGALVVAEDKDRFGNPLGTKSVINVLDGSVVRGQSPAGGMNANTPNAQGTRPPAPAGDPAGKVYDWTPKNTMFAGAGIVPMLAQMGQRIGGQFGAEVPAGQLAADQRRHMEGVRFAIGALDDGKGGLGIPKVQIEQALKLFADMGTTQDPLTAVQAGKSLYQMANDQIDFNESIMSRPTVYDKRTRERAASARVGWERVRASLPSLPEMNQFEMFMQGRAGPGVTAPPGATISNVYQGMKGALSVGKKNISHELETMNGTPNGTPPTNQNTAVDSAASVAKSTTPKTPPAKVETQCISEGGSIYCKKGNTWIRQ